nr:MAG TPA: hypothetical protein [Caudoviricetes sp.]
MKRYNLSQIMKDAHRFYRSKSRMGRTFGECLKLAWGWAKDEVKFKEEREAKIQAMIVNKKPVERTSYNDNGLFGLTATTQTAVVIWVLSIVEIRLNRYSINKVGRRS